MDFEKKIITLMLIFICLILLSTSLTAAAAEENEQLKLNLKKAVEIAKEENFDLKKAEIELEQAELNYQKLKAENLLNNKLSTKISAENSILSSEKTFKDTEADLIQDVISQYSNLWIQSQQIEVQEITLQAEKRLYNEKKARYDLAEIDRIDLLDQYNTYRDAEVELQNLKDDYQQMNAEFKSTLNINSEIIELEELSLLEYWQITRAEALKMGMENSYQLKILNSELELSQLNYQKSKISDPKLDRKISELSLDSAEINLENTKNNLENEIIQAYLSLKQAENNISLRENYLTQSKEQYNQLKKQYELGSVTKTSVLQYEAAYLTQEYQYKNAVKTYYLAEENLADILNLEPGVTLNE